MAAIATGGATTVLSRSLETRPSTQISASWSLTRQQDGEQIYWMAVVLAAMLCGIGRKAEGFAPGVAATNSVGSQGSPMALASLPTGKNPVRSFIPVARISDMLLNPARHFVLTAKGCAVPICCLCTGAATTRFTTIRT
jgi:biotin/methionine sulfoxide reductase